MSNPETPSAPPSETLPSEELVSEPNLPTQPITTTPITAELLATEPIATTPMVAPPPMPPQAMPMQMPPQAMLMQAPPPSHPYRLPTTPVEPPMPVYPDFRAPKKPRPILGSALAVYGVLLWSFVVAGELATSWISGVPISQGSALFMVFAATVTAWVVALRRSRAALPATTLGRFIWRGIGISALSFLFFFVTLIGATMFGQSTHGHDFLIAFVLVSLALTGIVMGPRLTLPIRPQRTQGARFIVISMWIVGVILTFVAGAELATNG